MSPQTLGILIGGIAPAILYGFTNVFAKAASTTGVDLAPYLVVGGLSIALSGIVFYFIQPGFSISSTGVLYTFGLGLTWGLGSGCVAIALSKYNAPISVLTPLFNTNTLVAVLLGLVIFAEWKAIQVPQLVFGSVLIVAGSVLVARA